jgi:signal peptide peptidase SppA
MAESSVRSKWHTLLGALVPPPFRAKRPLVAVVRMTGVIGTGLPFRPGLSLHAVAPVLERAFGLSRLDAVALVVNSPGGSAVQSHLIFRRIRDLAEEKGVPVFVFVEDMAASGGYMIACAGDEIFADPSSLVGSIGVIYAAFGLDRLLERFGVERRVHTQGERKAMLDPFRPENHLDVARLEEIQARVHQMFTQLVRERRGAQLRSGPDELFSGAIWSGHEGVDLGLVDAIGDLRGVMRQRFGDKVRLKAVSSPPASLLSRLFRRREPSVGALFNADEAIAALEDRLAWARWGL